MKLSSLRVHSVKSHFQVWSKDGRNYAHRNTTIELARIVAALGVIAAHVFNNTDGAGRLVAILMPIRVPFFYSISLFLFIASLPLTTPLQVVGRIWRRVLVPYLSWTFLYVLLFIIEALLTHSHRELVWWRIIFYGEGAVQLYFLPTLVMLQVVALGLYLLLASSSTRRLIGCLLLVSAVIYYVWGAHCRCTGMGEPNYFIGYSIYLTVAFGLAFAEVKQYGRIIYAIVGGCLVVLVVCYNYLGHKMLFFGYPLLVPLGGVGSLLLTTGLPTHWRWSWLPIITSLSFGIYLCHPLFIELFDFMVNYKYFVVASYAFNSEILEILLVFIASGILVLLLRQLKPIRQLLLGEK